MAVSLQEKNGKYYAVFRVTDMNGREKQKWVNTQIPTAGHNKRKAMAKAKEIAETYQEEKVVDYPKTLFSDWLRIWLDQKKMDIDIVTYQGYESYAKNHLIPYFAQKKLTLQNITPQDIQGYYVSKRKDPTKSSDENKGKLSGKSLKSHHIVIRGALEDAVRKNIIPYNPADRISVPKAEKYTGNFYTQDQVNELLRKIQGDIIAPIVELTVLYGMRRSEVLGLKWSSIDFERGTISILSTRVRFSEVVCKDKTKNNSSRRTYPMTKEVSKTLKRIRKEQMEYQLLHGETYQKSEYVFTWPDGRPYNPDFVTRHFATFLKKNNLPHIRFHDLRHTTASLLLSKGYQLKDIQEWLGHSDIGTTGNIYGHLAYENKKDMAQKMCSFLEVSKG